MTERERWIVYPLLFLALGSALRDKLFDITSSKRIVCEQMIVVGKELDSATRMPHEIIAMGEVAGARMNGQRFGAIEVDGLIRAHAVETDGVIKANTVYADNFVFRGIPFGPNILSSVPGVAPADWLRALQQSAEAIARSRKAAEEAAAAGAMAPEASAPAAEPADSTPVPSAESDADSSQ
jgi:hypothetical protein